MANSRKTEAPDAPRRVRTILLDDHPAYRIGVRLMLEADGFEVVAEADDGLPILSLIHGHDPDLCLVDWRMPGLSGLDTLRRIRARYAKRPAVVVLTGSAESDPKIVNDANDLGAVVLSKTIHPADLGAAIRAALNGSILLPRRNDPTMPHKLTDAQMRVLAVFGEQYPEVPTNREIAERLVLEPSTVKWHVTQLRKALGGKSRADLAAKARGL